MTERLEETKQLLADTLQIGEQVNDFDESTALLGNLPELDSMAVVNLITAIEEYYGFAIEDDEISADTFATLGNLANFIEQHAPK